MRHKNLQDYFDEMRDVYHSANAEIYKYKQELEFAQDFAAMDKGISANKRLAKAKQDYEIEGGRLKKEARQKIDEIRADYLAHTDSLYGLRADAIDNDVVSVLNAVKHNASEVDKLAVRFKQNPTMLRILSDHCEKHGTESKLLKPFIAGLNVARRDAESAFESANALITEKAWGTDTALAKIWSDNNRFNEIYDEMTGKVSGIGEVSTEE